MILVSLFVFSFIIAICFYGYCINVYVAMDNFSVSEDWLSFIFGFTNFSVIRTKIT